MNITDQICDYYRPKVRESAAQEERQPFPFFTRKLPPFDQEQQWMRETGLKIEEIKRLDRYIQDHLTEWNSIDTNVLRIPKESSELPRTLHVFKENNQLRVQVLCKQKNGLRKVGEGSFKKVKRSVEWISQTLWAQSTVHCTQWERVESGLTMHEKVADQPGVFPLAQGKSTYSKNYWRKLSFFTPLYPGTLESLLLESKSIDDKEKFSITHQLLKVLCMFEKRDFSHFDLYDHNIFFYCDQSDQIRIEIADFDNAGEEKDLRNKREVFFKSDYFLYQDMFYVADFLYKLHDLTSPFQDVIHQLRRPPSSAHQVLEEFERERSRYERYCSPC